MDADRPRPVYSEQDPLSLQMRHFVRVIRGDAEPLVSGREGLRTLEVTLAVKDAASSGECAARLTNLVWAVEKTAPKALAIPVGHRGPHDLD